MTSSYNRFGNDIYGLSDDSLLQSNLTTINTYDTKTQLVSLNGTQTSALNQLVSLNGIQTSSLTQLNNINNNTLSSSTQLQNLTNNNTLKCSIYAQAEGSGYIAPLSLSSEGHLEVSISEPRSAFGDVRVSQPTPVAQIDFIYCLNTNSMILSNNGSGSVTCDNGLLVCNSGTSTGTYGRLNSRQYLKYRPGQGSLARLTAVFSSGAANTIQLAGIGDDVDGYFFGYNGTQYGILYRAFGVDTWINQSSFTDDRLDGSSGINNKSAINIDPTKGNVYQISQSYLGYGNIFFFIMNKINGQFVLCHQIKYPNTYTTQLVRNPTFSLMWEARALSNVSNIQVKSASGALFVDGLLNNLGNKYGFDFLKGGISSLVPLFTIRNNSTFNGTNNKSLIRIQTVSACSRGGTGIVSLYLTRNGTLNAPIYNDIQTNVSIVSTDTNSTTITGGINIYILLLNNDSNQIQNIISLDLDVAPGEILTVACKSTNSSTVASSINWIELI